MTTLRIGLLLLLPLLAACEQLGLETPAQQEARAEAEGKAVGGACRQAGRALEDCYQINPRAPKAAIFAGWRDMDAYMRENKIDNVSPQFPMQPPGKKRQPLEEAPKPIEDATKPAEEAPAAKPEEKTEATKPADGKAAPAETKPTPPAEEKPAKKKRATKQS